MKNPSRRLSSKLLDMLGLTRKLTRRGAIGAFGIAISCCLSATPAYSDVDLVGTFNPGVIADPWIITNNTTIGFQDATFLDVHNGGTVDATGANFLTFGDGGAGRYVQVNVRDPGSSLSARNLTLNNGTVSRMFIENGGAVTIQNDLDFESSASSVGDSVIAVRDSGSQLTVRGDVRLRHGEELLVAEGAAVSSGLSGSVSFTWVNDATLRGAGTTWIDHNQILVGGRISVEDGAHWTTTIGPNQFGVSRFEIAGSGGIHLQGGSLTAQEISRDGAGRLHLHSGALTLNQSGLTVGSSGLMGDTVRIDAVSAVDVSGDVVVNAGAELFVAGSLVSSSLINNGSLTLQGATLDQAVSSPAGSTIDIIGDATFNGPVSGAGGVFGSGTATFNGGYSPGDSPAVVPIATDLALGASGELSIELAGTDHGTFDQLSVTGDVSLDGTLGLSLIDGFTLRPGQQFTILDVAGELTGQFAGLPEGALVGAFGGVDVSISYAAGDGNNVALLATAIPEPAAATLLSLAVCALLCARGRPRSCFCHLGVGVVVCSGLCASPSWAEIETRGAVSASMTTNGTSRFRGPWNTTSLTVGRIGDCSSGCEPGLVFTGSGIAASPGDDTINVAGSIRVGTQTRGTLFVRGTNSVLTSGDAIRVGENATGLFLATQGATVETGDAEIGFVGAVGIGRVEISDSGTSWSHYDLDISREGELHVRNGASVETQNFATLNGRVTVAGPGSAWTTGILSTFSDAAITISDGARVNVLGEWLDDAPFLPEPVLRQAGVHLTPGASLAIRGGTLSANFFRFFAPGDVDFEHGTLDLSASGLAVGVDGLLGDTVTIDSSSTINLSDEVTIEAGATMAVAGTLTTSGVTNHGGLTFTSTTLDAPVTNLTGSTMDVIGDVMLGGMVSGPADIFGSGTTHFAGGYHPGDGAALVSIEGSAVFTESNTLFLEIGGTTPGVDHDRIEVGGITTLAGTLDVTLLDGFIPELGDSFAVLFSSGGFDATFSTLALPDLSAEGLAWELNPGGATLFLEAVPALDGDYNLDGTVDAADYTVWRDGLGTTFTPGDYDVWAANFGATAPAAISVPEPTAGLLLMIAVTAGQQRRRY